MSETLPLPSYAELGALVGELRSELAAARAEIAELRAENAELKRRLGMNSKNSSKPPSSDGLARPASLRKPSGRGPGKPRGTAGGSLMQVDAPDAVEVHTPQECRGCAGDLALAEVVSLERRQVFDLPEIRLRVTEQRIEHRRCVCGQVTAAAPPNAPAAPAQYGPQLKSLALYLLTRQHLPYERCAELLADVLGADVATATLLGWAGQAADAVAEHTEAVRQQLVECEVVGFDETGTRVAGRTCWVHTACTRSLTLYLVHAKRGVQAFEAMGVLPYFTGVAVHDGWKPYKTYTDVAHALCNAHHLRELAAVVENVPDGRPETWAGDLATLLVDTWDEVKAIRAAHPHSTGFTVDTLERLARYEEIVAAGRTSHPARAPGEPRRKRSKAANLLDRLDTERDQVLRFAFDWRVPFDNNTSEQAIRMAKIQQKVTGGWRTALGAERYFTVRGYLSTAAKQGHNLLDAIARLFDPRGAWIPVPT
ncbi:IS66 family transposase [Kitasatospora sp. MAP5-34]|uniref:IS66 family transposase n=1 Tax=Kitasatospora sp. MAP5-34 TaxID=3035102 RepID=UPI0024765267|nr:IS66 family transposase [Kitasatospora sp. MAP5-34]MDH6579555.1 transposase [Kitasatospora sp. MAP5-34]